VVLEQAVQVPAFKKYPKEHLVATKVVQAVAPVGHLMQAFPSTPTAFNANPVLHKVIILSDEQVSELPGQIRHFPPANLYPDKQVVETGSETDTVPVGTATQVTFYK
jgi:hypothetical protein